MTEDLENLIEDMEAHSSEVAEAFAEIVRNPDSFRRLQLLNGLSPLDTAYLKAVREAKAITLRELVKAGTKVPAIAEALGFSRQRVYELMNGEPYGRRKTDRTDTAPATGV